MVVEVKDGVWTINAEGLTTFASPRMAEILGTTPDEMVGRSSFDYVYPEEAAAARVLFQAKQDGHIEPFEFRLRRHDGSPTRVRITGTAMYDPDGNFSGIVGVFQEL